VLKAIIVEDEPLGRTNLKSMIRQYCPDVEVIGEAGSNAEGLELLKDIQDRPDIAFLDIKLPDGLVFKLLNQIASIDFEVVFVTAWQEFAIKACEYSSIGYILKPIDPDALKEAVARVRSRAANQIEKRLDIFNSFYHNPNAFSKMSVSAVDGIYFVNIRDIVRFEAEDNYTHIFLNNNERITACKTIKSYEDLLGPMNFFRVHKRYMINLNYMRKYIRGDGGYVIMEDSTEIEVSRRRRAPFIDLLRRLQGGRQTE
jgi:two-component system LytT family response regulator